MLFVIKPSIRFSLLQNGHDGINVKSLVSGLSDMLTKMLIMFVPRNFLKFQYGAHSFLLLNPVFFTKVHISNELVVSQCYQSTTFVRTAY
jgi:hypothetical protein